MRRPASAVAAIAAVGALVVSACDGTSGAAESRPATTAAATSATSTTPTTTSTTTTSTTTSTTTTTTTEPEPTAFAGSVAPVDEARLGLSWRPGCPVGAADLRLLTLTFHGFDGRAHTGELIVHRSIAERTVRAFEELWDAGFPINRMDTAEKFARPEDFDPDGSFIETHGPDLVNDTSAFFCRPTTGGGGWSQHSYGTAIDVNPVQNPYVKGDTVIPPNGTLPRDAAVPGTIVAGSVVVRAMRRAGLTWGGTWHSLKDYMHFSANGR